jgi:hypothetical protein
MLQVGGIYKGKNGRSYLGLYNYQHDIYSLAPPALRGRELVAHFSYQRGGKKGGVNVFELQPQDPEPGKFMKIKKIFKVDRKSVSVEETETEVHSRITRSQIVESGIKYGRLAELNRDLSAQSRQEILDLVDSDIAYFCGKDEAKNPRQPNIALVNEIIPTTTLERITPMKMITGGKQWIVPECCLEGNIDYGQGCTTGWVPGDNATFDGKTFVGWFSDPFGECDYCYAERKHRCPPKTVYRRDDERERAELLGECRLDFGDVDKTLGRPLDILRFGKRTEVWAPWSKNSFVRTLEIIADIRQEGAKTKGVITTKMIPFRKEIAKLINKTHSQILYSYGWDNHELGACAHGCDNEWRLEQAFKYREAKAASALYLQIVGHLPPTEREIKVLERTDYGKKLRMQLLPMRFRRKETALSMTGESWDMLKGEKNQYHLQLGNYDTYVFDGEELIVKRMHPFWLNLVKNNNGSIRMCHHDDRLLYCGGCFQRKGQICQERKKAK